MNSTSWAIVASALTSGNSSLTFDERRNEPSSSTNPDSFIASPFGSLDVFNAPHPVNDGQQNYSSIDPRYTYPSQDGNTPDYIPNHDTRGPSGLLDTRQWGLLPDPASYATSGTHFPLAFIMGSHELLVPDGIHPCRAPKSQVIPYLPDLSLGSPGPTSPRQYHASLGTDVTTIHFSPGYHSSFFAHQPNHHAFPTKNVMPLPSPDPIEGGINFAHAERQSPFVIYRAPEMKSTSRRRCQRACAIKIEGIWIDRDDLYTGAGQSSGIISVHACQWATSSGSNPCGMWIIGSRSRVGAHFRKWHPQQHVEDKTRCLWDGCTTSKKMLRGSINRHVVTVHFGEAFHCRGCNRQFSREDVYNEHVSNSRVCRDAGAVIVFETKRRVIDTRQVLQQEFTGDALRFSGQ